MPRAMIYTCVECGIQKKESNHWFVLRKIITGFVIVSWAFAQERHWINDEESDYICGHACAHKQLDQFLQSTAESK